MRALLDQEFLQKDLYEEVEEDVDFEIAKEGASISHINYEPLLSSFGT